MKQIDRLIHDHIRADVTALADSLVGATAFLTTDSDPVRIHELNEKAIALSAPFLDYEAAARAAGHGSLPRRMAQQMCEASCTPPHEIPIIGHYIVTAELADKLEARGERVERDFGGVIVWARKKSSDEHAEQMDAKGVSVEFLDRDPVLLAVASEIYP